MVEQGMDVSDAIASSSSVILHGVVVRQVPH